MLATENTSRDQSEVKEDWDYSPEFFYNSQDLIKCFRYRNWWFSNHSQWPVTLTTDGIKSKKELIFIRKSNYKNCNWIDPINGNDKLKNVLSIVNKKFLFPIYFWNYFVSKTHFQLFQSNYLDTMMLKYFFLVNCKKKFLETFQHSKKELKTWFHLWISEIG